MGIIKIYVFVVVMDGHWTRLAARGFSKQQQRCPSTTSPTRVRGGEPTASQGERDDAMTAFLYVHFPGRRRGTSGRAARGHAGLFSPTSSPQKLLAHKDRSRTAAVCFQESERQEALDLYQRPSLERGVQLASRPKPYSFQST